MNEYGLTSRQKSFCFADHFMDFVAGAWILGSGTVRVLSTNIT